MEDDLLVFAFYDNITVLGHRSASILLIRAPRGIQQLQIALAACLQLSLDHTLFRVMTEWEAVEVVDLPCALILPNAHGLGSPPQFLTVVRD